MDNQRIAYLDYARVFAVLLVIYGHLLTYDVYIPRVFIYAFHMPFFFFVSGMLHKFDGTIQWKKYIRTIIVPIIFFNLIIWLLYSPCYYLDLISSKYHGLSFDQVLKDSFVDGFIGFYKSGYDNTKMASGPTWFLIVLLICKILNDIFQQNLLKGVGTIVLLCILGKILGNHFFIAQSIMVFPFYFVGFYFKDRINKIITQPFPFAKFLICLLFTIILTTIQGRVSVLAIMFGNKVHVPFNIVLFYLNALIGSFMVLFFSRLFTENKFITDIAKSLITILGVQCIFNHLCGHNLGYNLNWYFTLPLSVCILLVCYGIHKIIDKYAPWILGKNIAFLK